MKTYLTPSFVALALATSGLQASAQDAAAPAAQETSEFGEPLIVNGERITDLEIKRFLVYGPGRNALEARKLEILMQQEAELRTYTERERLAEEQHTLTYDELTEDQKAAIDTVVEASLTYKNITMDDVRERLAEQNASFRERYPTLDPDTETERAYKTVKWYEDQVYQTMRFDEMFFSGHPDTWPAISVEAIHAGSPEFDLVADYATHYEFRAEQAAEAGLDAVPREDDMMMSLLRDYVMAALNSLVETRTAVDGIDPELVLEIEGLGLYDEVRTEDAYEEFKHAFTWRDIADAKRFLALQVATRQKLERLEVLRSRDDFMAEVAAAREAMAANMFNWQFIALMGHQFPSEEAYTEHTYLLESFKTLISEEIARDANGQPTAVLQEYLPYANSIMGLARCRTEVCFVSAFDFPKNEWRPDGFDGARERAIALRGEIDGYIDRLIAAEEAKQQAVAAGDNYTWPEDLLPFDQYWSNVLDLHSEFWDPPLPMTGKAPPELGRKNKGRFQGDAMTRNDYKRALGESSYYYYLYDVSSADRVFMEQEVDSVGGPYVAPWGYYIIYLRERRAPSHPLDMNKERHFEMLVEDYTRNAFTEFAHGALLESEISGMPDGLGH